MHTLRQPGHRSARARVGISAASNREADVLGGARFPDSIGLGAWGTEWHSAQTNETLRFAYPEVSLELAAVSSRHLSAANA